MVDIRRGQHRRRLGKTIGSTSSSISVVILRKLIVALVTLQGIRMLFGSLYGHSSTSSPDPDAMPLGIEEKLKDSTAHIRKSKPPPNDHIPRRNGSNWNQIVLEKKGTGSTNVGYVKDFDHERDNSMHRSVEISVTDVSPLVASLVHESSVKPCETIGQDGMPATNPSCLDPDSPLIAYNPESFSRTWCGQEIKPKSAVTMAEHCTDPFVHLFHTQIPPVSGENMPPILIKSKAASDFQPASFETIECDIPCQKDPSANGPIWFIDDENWTIQHTMADGWYDGGAKIERRDYMKNKYYSTQSWQSSIPLTHFNFDKHSLRSRPAIAFETAKEKAIYIVDTECSAAATKRSKYYSAMQNVVPVDSFGRCAHNAEVPDGMTTSTSDGRIALMKQYRVVLAFDVSKSKDHISEIVWEAMLSGAVPVVVGAENIRDHLPPHSFIDSAKYSSWDELADYVKKVIADKQLWESYQKWRDDEEALAAFENKYEFTKTSPECRTCRWAYAKKYGLGWDHANQNVRYMRLPRERLCTTADHGLVSKPFSELWIAKTGGDESTLEEDSEGESCSTLTTDGDVDVVSFKGHRKIVHHDGVTDFIISDAHREHIDTEIILRLVFPGLRNPDGACFFNTHSLVQTTLASQVSSATIQDNEMKVTVLADWETTLSSTGEGIIDVVIQRRDEGFIDESSLKRIRVIIEEMTLIHDKMTEFYPSTFGQLMTKDFANPVRAFFADS